MTPKLTPDAIEQCRGLIERFKDNEKDRVAFAKTEFELYVCGKQLEVTPEIYWRIGCAIEDELHLLSQSLLTQIGELGVDTQTLAILPKHFVPERL